VVRSPLSTWQSQGAWPSAVLTRNPVFTAGHFFPEANFFLFFVVLRIDPALTSARGVLQL
jgi:hypothetical protein